MAKKKRKAKRVKLGGLRIPRSLIGTAMGALQSPVGKIILAEALIQAATLLVTRHPTAAATAAGAGAATAAKDAVGSAGEAAAKFMNSTADLLKSSVGANGDGGKSASGRRKVGEAEPRDNGNGADKKLGALDRDTIREILIGELSRRKTRKKAKHAGRH